MAAWRLLRVLLHVLAGYCRIRLTFGRLDVPQRQAHVQRWAARFLQLLGVSLRLDGDLQHPRATGLLLVANHISWLDILVLLAARPVRFVSKSEVAAWPFIGLMATGAGTLYIARERKRDALRMVQVMQSALQDGHCVGVFPEGTTSDGSQLLPFHANLLQSAVATQTAVLPVAMAFVDAASGRISQAASFVGDVTLAGSLWRFLGHRHPLQVRLHFLPLSPAQANRREWAEQLQVSIGQAHQRLLQASSEQSTTHF
jgi:1-acyl-sn-glycerol-3-phosphate acyltransferase